MLVWVFGGLLAAALPVAVAGLAIVGSMAVLRLIAMATDVSIFALNCRPRWAWHWPSTTRC